MVRPGTPDGRSFPSQCDPPILDVMPLGASFIMTGMSDAHRLVAWFRANARPLPWRTAPRDPYRSLVSELMAQQTQLDRVVPRFEAFVRRFPDLLVLADASEDEVLEMWSGLGYYRRARLLHRLAREVAAGGGKLPVTAAGLEKLPGIGSYTAAAVASMVHGEAVPAIDGNVARVGTRVLALAEDPRTKAGGEAVGEWVRGLMQHAPPGAVNEALMELGAAICTPARPDCGHCPLAGGCRARGEGDPSRYPGPRRTRSPVDLRWVAVIAEDPDRRWLLSRVTEGPILRGLWLPPFAEIDTGRSLEEQARGLVPFAGVGSMEIVLPVKHSITHRRIEVTPVRTRVEDLERAADGFSWVDPANPGLPTSSLLGKLLKAVSS
jgi:A/G-specific adenine glycosylase